ncbi:hypothetical protein ATCC90586_003067 [Pythium insidiosum]|nr:hypothetical protein ATCC90586_003067 [Pythium insidiosum]
MAFSPDALSRHAAVMPHAFAAPPHLVLLRKPCPPAALLPVVLRSPQHRHPIATARDAVSRQPIRKTKRLSTERSRRCRQRQKLYVDTLETNVRELQAYVANLQTLLTLRRERALHRPASTFANIVREYCTVFQHGMAIEPSSDSKMLSAQQQGAFLNFVMDPDVVVFDWLGRSRVGTATLLNGWIAWSTWHSSLRFDLQSLEVLEADDDVVAITTRGFLRVVVSDSTFEHLFPHLAGDQALRQRLLGIEIAYPFRDIFYFSANGRVHQYSVDMDIVTALTIVIGDMQRVAEIVSPPNSTSINDLAVQTEGMERVLQQEEDPVSPPQPDKRLDLAYILS